MDENKFVESAAEADPDLAEDLAKIRVALDEIERKLEEGYVDSLSEGELKFLIWQIGQHDNMLYVFPNLPSEALAEHAQRIESQTMLSECSGTQETE